MKFQTNGKSFSSDLAFVRVLGRSKLATSATKPSHVSLLHIANLIMSLSVF